MLNQYLQIMLWTISNLVADEYSCQSLLIETYHQLLISAISKGFHSNSIKVLRETLSILDNLFDMKNASAHIFKQKDVYETILQGYASGFYFNDQEIQLLSLKSIQKFLSLNPHLLIPKLFDVNFHD